MELFKKNLIERKWCLKKITTPLRIKKRINDMNNNFNKIYRSFFLSSNELKRQKELEEYMKYQAKLKFQLENFIKEGRIYFKDNQNIKRQRKIKSAKFIDNEKLYFNIIISYDKKFSYQPHLYPINNIIRYNCVTESHLLNIVKKMSKKLSLRMLDKKMTNSPSLKRSLKLRSSLKNKTNLKSSSCKNMDSIKLNEENKNQIIKIKKSLNIKTKEINKNNMIKLSSKFLKKKYNLVENVFQPFQNLQNIISPIKQKYIINNYENINNYSLEPKNDSFKSNISNSLKRNLNHINSLDSLKHSKAFFQNNHLYYKINNNKKYINLDNDKQGKNNMKINEINKRTTIFEQNKEAFKLLPILNQTFNSTMDRSNRLTRNIKSFKNEEKVRTSKSKKKTIKITKKYFDLIEIPSMKKTLRLSKSKPLFKEVNKYIFENKKGQIKLNFSYREKKEKSPLTFVEEYNRMRNRRRRTNKKITSNIEFKALSGNIKENKIKTFLGLSSNTNKYY